MKDHVTLGLWLQYNELKRQEYDELIADRAAVAALLRERGEKP